MNIPDKIRIAGVNYSVEYEDRLNNGSTLAYGHIDYDNARIRLCSGIQDKQGECQTLIHELLHGIAKHFDLSIEGDENTIDKLAKGLYMVIKDNPDLFKDKSL